MKRTAGIIALALALAACLFAVGCAGESGSADNAITVNASGTAEVAPDKVALGMTLKGKADTQEAAIAASEKTAKALAEELKANASGDVEIVVGDATTEPHYEDGGTTTQDIATGYYDWYGNWISTGSQQVTQAVGNVLAGYDFKVHVVISNLNASALEDIIRACVKSGAIEFDELSFTLANRDAAYQQALQVAVDAAHEKAESLAKASGVYVGRVVNLVESTPADFVTVVPGDAGKIVVGDEATYAAAAGTVPVEANVTVSYAIQ